MGDSKACQFSYVLDGAGGGMPFDPWAGGAPETRLAWLHLNGRHSDTRKFLKDHLHLDQMVVKSLLAEETRPRIEEFGGGMLLILRGLHFNPGPQPEDLVSIRLWISPSRIISVGRRKARAIADIDERIRQGRGAKRLGEFIAQLCTSLLDGIEPTLDEMEELANKMEGISPDAAGHGLRDELAAIRKQAIIFRRHVSPQRDVISRLRHSDQFDMTAADQWAMQDSYDRITRFIEDLDVLRERSLILQDELHSALSGRLNKNLYILSVITAIFMPLTFLSGLLGMNVAGIPQADNPKSFIVVCGVIFIVGVLQLLLFRRLKWV